jgi:phosphoglycolate phosphatase
MNLLFDLDGTLTDPQTGITRCLVHALEQLGIAAPQPTHLRRYIGPPLRSAFAELLGTADSALIERAVALYRERFGEVGMFENELYPQAPASLAELTASGHRLFVATGKAELYAQRIVEHFGLSEYFVKVYGAALSGEGSHKRELLARLVAAEQIEPACSLMIGDRDIDVTGARANGMRSIGVLWGFGTAEELAGANRLVRTWSELLTAVASMDSPAGP